MIFSSFNANHNLCEIIAKLRENLREITRNIILDFVLRASLTIREVAADDFCVRLGNFYILTLLTLKLSWLFATEMILTALPAQDFPRLCHLEARPY